MNNDRDTALQALQQINPCTLDYQDWLNVGMALQHAGCSPADWDTWSIRDPRYKKGECARKWTGFRQSGSKPVTIGTLVKLCREHGGRVSSHQKKDEGREIAWEDSIGGGSGEESPIVRTEWLQDAEELQAPENWNPAMELTSYLTTLFDSEDHVGYVTDCWQNEEGKFLPKKGVWDRTAGQLIQELSACKGDIAVVIGDHNKECGAWIRFNPLDGRGCRDENVTNFKFALVESDTLSIEKQLAIYRELELPIAALVHSGGKSLHALCRVDAKDMADFRTRVDFLYAVCKKNGLEIDRQNRNPSRLSRMPGITRGKNKQWLVSTNTGKATFDEWKEYIEEMNDDLPDMDSLADWWNRMPELAPTMIEGILRQGHKLLLAGPSKAGKSFLLINLTICIAEGKNWLGWQCKKGKVLYVNLELDRPSCLHRFKESYNALGFPPENLSSVDIWNLRGKAQAMDKLAPKLIRRALKTKPDIIIIDPIYKVITGDENAADQMAKFCNQFDKLCTELKASVVYCHHHSKGDQGQKRAHDRASGSGVFARDPDALLDMIQLDIDENRRKQIVNRLVCEGLAKYLDKKKPEWRFDISQDDALIADEIVKHYDTDEIRHVACKCRNLAEKASGWRIEGILREFPELDIRNIFFSYPIHTVDVNNLLTDALANGEEQHRTPAQAIEAKKKTTTRETIQAYQSLASFSEADVTIKDLAEHLGITEKATRTRVANLKSEGLSVKGGTIFMKGKKKDEN